MEARLDKWLWAARIFKTRSLAADACKNGRVAINGAQAKPSRSVKEGDEVAVRKSPVTYTFRERETFNHFAGQFQSFVHGLEVFIGKLSQYEVNLSAAREIVADAKA